MFQVIGLPSIISMQVTIVENLSTGLLLKPSLSGLACKHADTMYMYVAEKKCEEDEI